MHTASKLAFAAAGFLLTLSLSKVARAQVYLDDFTTSYTGWSYLSTTQAGPYLWAVAERCVASSLGLPATTQPGPKQ